ncbi:MAG: hypothetical protein OXC91_08635 [Rhodobacteraceae bacterium]|nr:hypothetical protein [Paracoccaceae bacterium]
MALRVDVISNRSSPLAILPHETWREGRRVQRRTLAALSKMPPERIDADRPHARGHLLSL